ncbi:MAG: PKD domain-containing protein, partial [Ilumatobacteraceae bacterium]
RGRASMPVVDLDSDAPVTIGAKTVIGADNDQFHGVLDDVYMTVLNEDLPVDVAPVAAFTSQCVDQSCTFDGSSSTDDGALSFAWDFGDAATDTVVAPTHEFADIGDHDVTLVVTDAQGASASIVHTVTTSANEPPVATFSSSCRYSSCSFDASGSTDASPLTYAWDFGDGATDTAVTPVHVFSELGDHLVRLTVTDPSGLTGVSEQMVSTTENTPPIASFIESCTDLACTFDASASSDAGPLTYSWAFGDGASATLTDPAAQHSFSAGGTFHVVLTVIDDGDATAVAEHDVTVTRPVEPITFVGRSTSSTQATAFSAAIPNTVQAGDALLMFVSLGTGAKVGQPAGVTGWVAVDTLTTSSGSTHVWRKVASASDAGRQVRVTASSRSKGNLTVVAYRGTSTANPIAGFARSLLTNNSAYRTTPTTTVAAPTVVVSYWMHRDNKTTSLTVPAGVTSRSTGTESGNNHVTVLVADSGADVPAGPYGGLTSRAMAASTLGTAWTIVLAPA